MALNTEVASIMEQPGRVYEVAEKVNYGLPMNSEENDMAQVLDSFVRDIGNKGYDEGHQLAQFLTKTVTDDVYNAPDELLDVMFRRSTVGEFDDYQANRAVKNTLVAHEAAKGGNVPRSYLNFETIKPKWFNLQVESDISFTELRRGGIKSVATLTTYMSEALKNKMFYNIFNDIDAAITGGEQKIDAQSKTPTMEAMDKLALYLNEHTDGTNPFTVSLQKYVSQMRRMTGYAQYLSDAAKDEFNRYGLVKTYDGVAITGISSAKKLGDGSLLIPDKAIYGFAGVIGELDMKGDIHTYEDYDNNNEKVHLMMKDFTFGYSIDHIDRIAKITLQ